MNSVLPLTEGQQNNFNLYVYGTKGHENKLSMFIPFLCTPQDDLKYRVPNFQIFFRYLEMQIK